jgi:hypothetical protein
VPSTCGFRRALDTSAPATLSDFGDIIGWAALADAFLWGTNAVVRIVAILSQDFCLRAADKRNALS